MSVRFVLGNCEECALRNGAADHDVMVSLVAACALSCKWTLMLGKSPWTVIVAAA